MTKNKKSFKTILLVLLAMLTIAGGIVATILISDNNGNKPEITEVNVLALENTIQIAESFDEINYTIVSYDKLKSEVVSSKTLLGKENLLQSEVNQALEKLKASITDLVLIDQNVVNINALKATVSFAKTFIESDYTTNSFQNLLSEINLSEAVIANEVATQIEVDSKLDQLVIAISNLELKEVLEVDTSALNNVISLAKNFLEKDYTTVSFGNLTGVLTAADDVANSSTSTQGEVDDALTNLQKAITDLVLKGNQTKLLQLVRMIESLNLAQYTPLTADALSNKTNEIIAVLDGETELSQIQVDDYFTELSSVHSELVERGDKTNLNLELKDASKYYVGDYEATSFAEFKEVVSLTEVVLHDVNANQLAVDEALQNLNTAVNNLVEIPFTVDERVGWAKDHLLNTEKFPQENAIKEAIAAQNGRFIEGPRLRSMIDLSTLTLYGITPGTLTTREAVTDMFGYQILEGEITRINDYLALLPAKLLPILELNKWYVLGEVLMGSSTIMNQGGIGSNDDAEKVRLTYENGVVQLEVLFILMTNENTLSDGYEYHNITIDLRNEKPIFTMEKTINYEGSNGYHNVTQRFQYDNQDNFILIDGAWGNDNYHKSYFNVLGKVIMGLDENGKTFYEEISTTDMGYSKRFGHFYNYPDRQGENRIDLSSGSTYHVSSHVLGIHDDGVDLNVSNYVSWNFDYVNEYYTLPLYLFEGFTKYELVSPSAAKMYSIVDGIEVAFPIEFSLYKNAEVHMFSIDKNQIDDYGYEMFEQALIEANVTANQQMELVHQSTSKAGIANLISQAVSSVGENPFQTQLNSIVDIIRLLDVLRQNVHFAIGKASIEFDGARPIYEAALIELGIV